LDKEKEYEADNSAKALDRTSVFSIRWKNQTNIISRKNRSKIRIQKNLKDIQFKS